MQGDIQSLALIFFRHPDADHEFHDVEGHEGQRGGLNGHQEHCPSLE